MRRSVTARGLSFLRFTSTPSAYASNRGGFGKQDSFSSTKVKTAVALLEDIEEPLGLPADEVAANFFRRKLNFTPQEKRESSKLAFDVLRYWDRLGWWLGRLRKEIPELTKRFGLAPRLRVLSFMVLNDKWGEAQLRQHMGKLTIMEVEIAKKLQGKELVDDAMPPWLQL